VVEGQLGRHGAVAGGGGRRRVPVQQRVDVVPLGEHAPVGVEPLHLAEGPVHVVVVAPVEDPVDRQVRAEVEVAEQLGIGAEAEVLQRTGGDEAAAGEQPRSHHAAGVEVVALVPAVVGHLVSGVRLHEGEQHRAQPHLAPDVAHGGGAYDPPMPGDDLVRMVPILTAIS